MGRSKTYPHVLVRWHKKCNISIVMRIDVQFSGENGRSRQKMRGFHAGCGENGAQGGRALEVAMAVGASIVMITFVGLLLRALG